MKFNTKKLVSSGIKLHLFMLLEWNWYEIMGNLDKFYSICQPFLEHLNQLNADSDR